MRHEIPTHLSVEDKILGSLTTRQLLFLAVGLSIGYGLWKRLVLFIPIWEFRIVIALIPLIISLIFAFIRPYDRALEEWLFMVIRYNALPKLYIWQPRGGEQLVEANKTKRKGR